MKRSTLLLTILFLAGLACNLTAGTPTPTVISEHRCGDGVCDGPENGQNCPSDCAASDSVLEDADPGHQASASEANGLLYHLTENTITASDAAGENCYTFSFLRFLDAGYVQPDGMGNITLELQDHPTSKVTGRLYDRYYYISTPEDPARSMNIEGYNVQSFDWDVAGQALWSSPFDGDKPDRVTAPERDKFPGGVLAGPGNHYLIYPLTSTAPNQGMAGNVPLMGKFNPFQADSSLVILTRASGQKTTLLANAYNRALFESFGDFSPDGRAFYTLTIENNTFRFVKISLESGQVTDFREAFPRFDWDSLDWNAFFPRGNDFAYAAFTISPDESRMIAYKNVFTANLTGNLCVAAASHNLWVFNLDDGSLQEYRDQPGYVSSASWNPDSSAFALALVENAGCYPGYLNSQIEIFDKDGRALKTLVTEPKSKITTIGWSPDGRLIAYDVYSTDLIGWLKTVEVSTGRVEEVINSQNLGYAVSETNPVTILFADWVEEK